MDAEGVPERFVAIRTDISRLKKVEADLQELTRKLDERVKQRTAELENTQAEVNALNRELEARANQLASYLRKQGVGPDVMVGICVDRSPDMVVGLLGILKAGGAYVPLNVEDPPQRLASIIRNAGASIILTEDKYVKKLPKTRT